MTTKPQVRLEPVHDLPGVDVTGLAQLVENLCRAAARFSRGAAVQFAVTTAVRVLIEHPRAATRTRVTVHAGQHAQPRAADRCGRIVHRRPAETASRRNINQRPRPSVHTEGGARVEEFGVAAAGAFGAVVELAPTAQVGPGGVGDAAAAKAAHTRPRNMTTAAGLTDTANRLSPGASWRNRKYLLAEPRILAGVPIMPEGLQLGYVARVSGESKGSATFFFCY